MQEIELTPSVPVTPSEEPAVAPAEVETPAVEEPVAEPEKFQMPDGRMLTGAEVKAEYENLNRDYTQKSQKLAELTRDEVPEWKKEGYTPKSYAEIVELGKQEALREMEARASAEEARRAEVSQQVEAQVAALKAKDPKLDENALFAHATKYGFRDLNLAYANMSEIKTVARVTEERVLQGVKKKTDPIATGTGTGSGSAPRYPQASSATEFLSRLKK